MSKYSLEQLNLFYRFAYISEERQYTMNFLGDVPQFYTQKCNENGVLQTRKGTNGHRCNICHEFLLSSSVKPLRKILLKRTAIFQKMVDIPYKHTLVDSDQSSIHSFIKSQRSCLSSSGMELLHKSKYHIDIHIELKGIFQNRSTALLDIPLFKFLVPMYYLMFFTFTPKTLH